MRPASLILFLIDSWLTKSHTFSVRSNCSHCHRKGPRLCPICQAAACHSLRNARIGCSDDARRAGITDAASASTRIAVVANPRATGSSGLTWNKRLRRRRVANTAPIVPIRHPARPSFTPEFRTRPSKLTRGAPSASRIANSCVRCIAEKATTEAAGCTCNQNRLWHDSSF